MDREKWGCQRSNRPTACRRARGRVDHVPRREVLPPVEFYNLLQRFVLRNVHHIALIALAVPFIYHLACTGKDRGGPPRLDRVFAVCARRSLAISIYHNKCHWFRLWLWVNVVIYWLVEY